VVLEKKVGLTNSADLARWEERISMKKAFALFEHFESPPCFSI
jgi:hypothetical protein